MAILEVHEIRKKFGLESLAKIVQNKLTEIARVHSRFIEEGSVKFLGTTLFIQIKNSYDNEPIIKNEQLLTTKKDKGHGYGIKNIKECLEHYKGNLDYSYDDNVFVTEIIIPNAVNE